MQIVIQILSCLKISSTRLLALQCSKKLTSPMTLTEYSSSFPKSIFNVHQITTSGEKFNIFFWQGHGQEMPTRMHQNTPLQVKYFFWGSPYPSPGEQGLRTHSPYCTLRPPPSLLDPPVRPPQNCSQIYVTAPILNIVQAPN